MDAERKCKAMSADGRPCRAPAQKGKAYCFQHDPEQAQAAEDARRKGGEARAAQLSGAIVPSLTTAEGVRDYIAQAARDTAAGLMDARRARAIAGLCRVQLVAIEHAEREADCGWMRALKIGGDCPGR